MFKTLNTLLKEIVKKDKDFLHYEEIKKRWKKTNKKIQKNAEIIDFTKGELTLKAKNSVWKNELVFIQEDLKKNFQTKQ